MGWLIAMPFLKQKRCFLPTQLTSFARNLAKRLVYTLGLKKIAKNDEGRSNSLPVLPFRNSSHMQKYSRLTSSCSTTMRKWWNWLFRRLNRQVAKTIGPPPLLICPEGWLRLKISSRLKQEPLRCFRKCKPVSKGFLQLDYPMTLFKFFGRSWMR